MLFPRIKELRTEHNLTQREVAEHLQIHRSVYSRYERGVLSIPVGVAVELADLYQCSLDYLAGLTDEKR